MTANENQNKKQDQESQKPGFRFLSFKNKFDKSYIPDLRQQWEGLDNSNRRKFVFGIFIGLIIVIAGVALLFILMTNLIQQ